MDSILTNNIVEICETEEDKLAGRVKIKLIAHEIYPDTANDEDSEANRNGISWREEWVKLNLKSCINMGLVVSYVDKETGLIAGHGKMVTYSDAKDGEGIEFEDSEVVGTVYNAYITDIEINGTTKKVLMLEGYIYSQRNLGLVKFLREQINENKNTICGSIEINADKDHDEIIYLNGKYNPDGSLNMHRIPQYYDYSYHAILYLEKEADSTAQVVEMNSINNQDNGVGNKMSNKLNSTSSEENECKDNQQCNTCKNREECNKCKNNETNKCNKEQNGCNRYEKDEESNECKTKNEKNACDKKDKECNTMNQEELNAKITELNSKLESVDKKVTELNSVIEEKDAKIAELNEVIVENTKTITELTEKNTANEAELNSCKEKVAKYEQAEADAQKEAEINKFMEGIKDLKLNEAELNSVNSVETLAEKQEKVSEICIARCKANVKAETEVNTKQVEVNSTMFTIPEPKKEILDGEVPTIW